jgi:hypothetical protein
MLQLWPKPSPPTASAPRDAIKNGQQHQPRPPDDDGNDNAQRGGDHNARPCHQQAQDRCEHHRGAGARLGAGRRSVAMTGQPAGRDRGENDGWPGADGEEAGEQ